MGVLTRPAEPELAAEAIEEFELAFAPLHKRCLGVAVGAATGLFVLALTLVHVLRSPGEEFPLVLLQNYFVGYHVSVSGAFVGLLWGFWMGFVIGWFFAFARNAVLALTSIFFRARAELAEDVGFIDHI